jgi:hypothetical protein
MTEGATYVTAGVFLAASFGAQILDYIETQKALDKGATEVGLIASKVVKKWGRNALPLFTFICSFVILVGAAVFGTLGGSYMLAYTAPLFAGLAYNDIRNLIKLKK